MLDEEYDLILKPHPSSDIRFYQDCVDMIDIDMEIADPKREAARIASGCRFVISPVSTVVFEVLLQKIPVIHYDVLSFLEKEKPFDGNSELVYARSPKGLAHIISKGLYEYKDYSFIEKYVGDLKVSFSDRMLDALEDVLQRNSCHIHNI